MTQISINQYWSKMRRKAGKIKRGIVGLSKGFRQDRLDYLINAKNKPFAYLETLNILLSSYYFGARLVEQIFDRKDPIPEFILPEENDLASSFAKRPVSPMPEHYRYRLWHIRNAPRPSDLQQMKKIIPLLSAQPLISIIVPVYNTPEKFLREAIDSVRAQIYSNWQLCIADDASTQPHVKEILEEYSKLDDRIKVVYRQENGHISNCSNSALSMATGEFIALLDHDDLLTPDALYHIVVEINHHPNVDLIYSDEDKVDRLGYLIKPSFKPDWSPEALCCRMYICHLTVYRRQLVEEVGGFRSGYEGAQDYDLALRVTEKTNQIQHIPRILYHWRIHSQSSSQSINIKSYAIDAGCKSLSDALNRREESGTLSHLGHGHWLIRYKIKEYEKVAVIIPTKNFGSVLDVCLESIYKKTTYPNFEVFVIDNGSTEENTLSIFKKWQTLQPDRFRCELLDIPFNFSKINNYAVGLCQDSRYIVMLNNDTEVIEPEWMTAMVEYAQRFPIGAVGGQMLYPDNSIQEAGIYLDSNGHPRHPYKYARAETPDLFFKTGVVNNYSAIGAACLMCRREVYLEVGGLEEELAVTFNDVDFCLKLLDKGYRNVYLPHVKLYHYESKSRGKDVTPEKKLRYIKERNYFKEKWGEKLYTDPYYNINSHQFNSLDIS